ncbi:hypothetical protein L596_007737 [Steinernema carpocapsae]|uniref:Uncharacterized protein n=1 Tax=Steinernema carpocapsae TaxID=34508 RepID=A0A4U5PAU6_STECR|nr:hypothetical protein L596_007737 [Steinernema carpocapsae]
MPQNDQFCPKRSPINSQQQQRKQHQILEIASSMRAKHAEVHNFALAAAKPLRTAANSTAHGVKTSASRLLRAKHSRFTRKQHQTLESASNPSAKRSNYIAVSLSSLARAQNLKFTDRCRSALSSPAQAHRAGTTGTTRTNRQTPSFCLLRVEWEIVKYIVLHNKATFLCGEPENVSI